MKKKKCGVCVCEWVRERLWLGVGCDVFRFFGVLLLLLLLFSFRIFVCVLGFCFMDLFFVVGSFYLLSFWWLDICRLLFNCCEFFVVGFYYYLGYCGYFLLVICINVLELEYFWEIVMVIDGFMVIVFVFDIVFCGCNCLFEWLWCCGCFW